MCSDAEVDPRLAAFLAGRMPVVTDRGRWPSGLAFEVTPYFTDELPPVELVTSVRALVIRGHSVLVFDDDEGRHVIPGGRVEPGEALLDTLARELREETGCEISGEPLVIGCLPFHHVGPRPEAYGSAYPDVFQLIYLARTSSEPLARDGDPLVVAPRFIDAAEVGALPLPPVEHAFLRHPLVDEALKRGV